MSGFRSIGRRTATSALPTLVAALGITGVVGVTGVVGTAAPAGAAPRPAAGAAAAPSAASQHGTSLTCRGEGVDPKARVRYRSEILVHAPIKTVWKLQADVAGWPGWQAPVATAERLDRGHLHKNSAFRWTTPVPATPSTPATTLVITSTVKQLKHNACIRWTGPATGGGIHIDGVHVWNFIPTADGVLVRTEETHTGPQVDANVPYATEILGKGLDAWLAALRTTAEHRAAGHRR